MLNRPAPFAQWCTREIEVARLEELEDEEGKEDGGETSASDRARGQCRYFPSRCSWPNGTIA